MKAEFELDVPQSQVDAFFSAIGWTASSRPPIPPTLPTIFRRGEFEILQSMGIPVNRLLHGDQEYRFIESMRPGERYRATSSIKKQHEKSGATGSLRFFLFETLVYDSKGALCVECLTNLVVREEK